ncbi:myb-like protein F [Sitophilus oryzae]|uniref:Myb-like protein F n=1 Tax=Sitophilus oryzae TaxID=7048 RepID=A0A6J2X4S1_SITOR|nr:myb-like protein F [Sitophilus oryzae]
MESNINYTLEEYYRKFIDLQDKLKKSEEQRFVLEKKFNDMLEVAKEEEQVHYKKLRSQYKRFLEEDRKRQERNEQIVRNLERIETRISMLSAKTERIDVLRKQYQHYLQRIAYQDMARRIDIKPFGTKRSKSFVKDEKSSLYHPEKSTQTFDIHKPLFDHTVNEKPVHRNHSNEEKIEILDKYLQSLSTEKSVDILNQPKTLKEPLLFDKYDWNKQSDYSSGYSNQAAAIAENIMDSIYSRHYYKNDQILENKKKSENTYPEIYPSSDGRFPGNLYQDYTKTLLVNDNSKVNDPEYTNGQLRNIVHSKKHDDGTSKIQNSSDISFKLVDSPCGLFENNSYKNYNREGYSEECQNNNKISIDNIKQENFSNAPVPQARINNPSNTQEIATVSTGNINQSPRVESKKYSQPSVQHNASTVKASDKEKTTLDSEKRHDFKYENHNQEQQYGNKAQFNNTISKSDIEVSNYKQNEQDLLQSDVQQNRYNATDLEVHQQAMVGQNQHNIHYHNNNHQHEDKNEALLNKNITKSDHIRSPQYNHIEEHIPVQAVERLNLTEDNKAGQNIQVRIPNNHQIEIVDKETPLHNEKHQTIDKKEISEYDFNNQKNQYDRGDKSEIVQSTAKENILQYNQHDPIQYQSDVLNEQLSQYDPGTQPVQQKHDGYTTDHSQISHIKSGQSVTYDHYYDEGQAVESQMYDQNGQSAQCVQNERIIPHDPHRQSVQYDQSQQPIPLNPNIQTNEYDQSKELIGQNDQQFSYNHGSQEIDQDVQPHRYDQSRQSFSYNNKGETVQYDQSGQAVHYDQTLQYRQENQNVEYDQTGHQIQYNENGHGIQYDHAPQYNQNTQQYDENGQPIAFQDQYQYMQSQVFYNQHGQIVEPQYDENGHMIPQYDENNQLIMIYDQNGQPINHYDQTQQQYYDYANQNLTQYGGDQYDQYQGENQNQYVENVQQGYVDGQTVNVTQPDDNKTDEIESKSINHEEQESKQLEERSDHNADETDETVEAKSNKVMEMLDTDTESSSKQNVSKVSNESDFDFS